jgi:hypothetical protein
MIGLLAVSTQMVLQRCEQAIWCKQNCFVLASRLRPILHHAREVGLTLLMQREEEAAVQLQQLSHPGSFSGFTHDAGGTHGKVENAELEVQLEQELVLELLLELVRDSYELVAPFSQPGWLLMIVQEDARCSLFHQIERRIEEVQEVGYGPWELDWYGNSCEQLEQRSASRQRTQRPLGTRIFQRALAMTHHQWCFEQTGGCEPVSDIDTKICGIGSTFGRGTSVELLQLFIFSALQSMKIHTTGSRNSNSSTSIVLAEEDCKTKASSRSMLELPPGDCLRQLCTALEVKQMVLLMEFQQMAHALKNAARVAATGEYFPSMIHPGSTQGNTQVDALVGVKSNFVVYNGWGITSQTEEENKQSWWQLEGKRACNTSSVDRWANHAHHEEYSRHLGGTGAVMSTKTGSSTNNQNR